MSSVLCEEYDMRACVRVLVLMLCVLHAREDDRSISDGHPHAASGFTGFPQQSAWSIH